MGWLVWRVSKLGFGRCWGGVGGRNISWARGEVGRDEVLEWGRWDGQEHVELRVLPYMAIPGATGLAADD